MPTSPKLATDLATALNVFDPQRALELNELEAYYVARPHAPLKEIKTYLRAVKQPVKVLFSGHRGSGKSTELTRLLKDLEDEFFVVRCTARSLSLADLEYEDIILSCVAGLFREAGARARDVKVPAKVLKTVLDWLNKEVTAETTIAVAKSGSIGAKLNAYFLTLEGKYAREATTRTVIRERLLPRLNELVEQTNDVCTAIEKATGRPPLILFEDLDKTDLAHARDLFFEHATTLTSLAARIIYTFPIALCYSTEFPERRGDYNAHFLLPNVSLETKEGAPKPEGHQALRQVVVRRAEPKLFDEAALYSIVELSGGLMRDLIRLVRDAALLALTDGKATITGDVVERVATGMRNDFRRVLLPRDYEELRKARESKRIVPDEGVRQVLSNLSLLEYRNDTAWCDVHPVVRPLLSQP